MSQLTPHFRLSEFTGSQTAARLRLDNTPPAGAIANLTALCNNVLEPLRAHYGRPIVISSGFRAPAVNRAIGGSPTSQHCKGEAADLEIPGVSNVDVARWIAANLAFDQLILEFYTPGQPSSGWVHVSYRPPCRRDVLTARRVRGPTFAQLRTEYVKGIAA